MAPGFSRLQGEMTTVGSPSELRDAFSLSVFHCSLLINALISHKTVSLKHTHTHACTHANTHSHTLQSRKDIFFKKIFVINKISE